MAESRWLGRPVHAGFGALPAAFYSYVAPQPLQGARLLHIHGAAAALLGLGADAIQQPEFFDVCAGIHGLPGLQPIASIYSGHQFGIWAGQLGDGRAHLLGAIQGTDADWELQLKGSGRTPYCRGADGRAVLRSSVREYLASAAMEGLGIPTTRALALISSDEAVYRETRETGAVVARLAPSFVRFGHFEHWAGSHGRQKALLTHVVQNHFPACAVYADDATLDAAATGRLLLEEVVRRSARLVAQWQLVGFCHGVLNTDNMSILGLTLDYGPYGFMDGFKVGYVCNHTDTAGRYAWNAQPAVVRWNLYRLAGSFLVLGCDEAALKAGLEAFEPEFMQAYQSGLAHKLGLYTSHAEDASLMDDWWALLDRQHADFTLAFRYLADVREAPEPWLSLFSDASDARQWLQRYQQRLGLESLAASERRARMHAVNPLYVLRNYLAQQAIDAAQRDDPGEIQRLLRLLRDPYTRQAGMDAYARPPDPGAAAIAVSCSS